jgi:hypothetical protein
MISKVILACLSCLLVLAIGCKSHEAPNVKPIAAPTPHITKIGESVLANAPKDLRLLGTWAENDPGGQMSYSFRADGTYQQIVLTTGIISGLASLDGDYTLAGNQLTMRETRGSWKPTGGGQQPGYSNKPMNGIERKRIQLPDRETLILVDEQTGYEDSLQRVPES